MRDSNLRKQSKKLMTMGSSVKTHVEVDTILMSMLTVVQVHTSVEKNLLLSNLLKVSQVDQD